MNRPGKAHSHRSLYLSRPPEQHRQQHLPTTELTEWSEYASIAWGGRETFAQKENWERQNFEEV